MKRTLAVLMALAVATPALAQDKQMLGIQLRQLKSDSDDTVLQGAFAACILGGGTVDGAANLFAENGWTRADDGEMGVTELRSDSSNVTVTLFDDGKICSVVSEAIGTERTSIPLVATITLAGWPVKSMEMSDGCDSYALGDAIVATVTSSGQDPVCNSDDSSDVRFVFD